MKAKFAAGLLLAAFCVMAASPLLAHHGTGVAYQVDKEVTLKGTVTQWIWANPHCGLLFDVTNDKGEVVHWGAELANPHALSEAGLSKDIFKPGDQVTVMGNPARSGAPRLQLKMVTTADGRELPEKGVKGNGVKLTDEPDRII
jgi:hypothetical protein